MAVIQMDPFEESLTMGWMPSRDFRRQTYDNQVALDRQTRSYLGLQSGSNQLGGEPLLENAGNALLAEWGCRLGDGFRWKLL